MNSFLQINNPVIYRDLQFFPKKCKENWLKINKKLGQLILVSMKSQQLIMRTCVRFQEVTFLRVIIWVLPYQLDKGRLIIISPVQRQTVSD